MDIKVELSGKVEVPTVKIGEPFNFFDELTSEGQTSAQSKEVEGVGTLTGSIKTFADGQHSAIFDLNLSLMEYQHPWRMEGGTGVPKLILYAKKDKTTYACVSRGNSQKDIQVDPVEEIITFDNWLETDQSQELLKEFMKRSKVRFDTQIRNAGETRELHSPLPMGDNPTDFEFMLERVSQVRAKTSQKAT